MKYKELTGKHLTIKYVNGIQLKGTLLNCYRGIGYFDKDLTLIDRDGSTRNLGKGVIMLADIGKKQDGLGIHISGEEKHLEASPDGE